MRNWLQAKFLGLMLVPPEPHPPAGSPGSIRVFRAGRNYYRFRVVVWAFLQWIAFVVVSIVYLAINAGLRDPDVPAWLVTVWRAVESLGLAVFLVVLGATFIAQWLNYSLRWYIVTDRSLRVRHGIWSTHELTTTFANIQEIRVSAGPLQRVLGLADVEIHSAGGGASGPHGGSGGHVARFTGLDNANEIRDYILESLRRYRDSGLGEPTHHDAAEASSSLAAAQSVLAEARGLRAALGKS